MTKPCCQFKKYSFILFHFRITSGIPLEEGRLDKALDALLRSCRGRKFGWNSQGSRHPMGSKSSSGCLDLEQLDEGGAGGTSASTVASGIR